MTPDATLNASNACGTGNLTVRMERVLAQLRLIGRRLVPHLGIAVLIALGALPVRAAEPATVELLDVFAAVCLAKFPDDADVRQYAREKQFDVMADERLHRLLGTDPGEGWVQTGAYRQYLLTIELPPYHTCAIRAVNAKTADLVPALSERIGSWAASQAGTSLKGPSRQTASFGGVPSEVYVWGLDRGQGKSGETLMAVVPSPPDVTEVRLVRGINR
jgi:hypothetical protein